MALTKINLIEKINTEIGLLRKESSKYLESIFEIIKDELAIGHQVKISGFGQWNVLNKNARRGRNPKTGKSMTIAARKVVTFKSSPVLRESIKSGI
jgi:integration host factor subunit alpha